jgi:GDP-L-fucose synthase
MIAKDARIYVSGHTGMAGSAMMQLLRKNGYQNLVFRDSKELDLRNQSDVERFMKQEKPEYVFLFAAKVGGIKASIDNPAYFMYDNLMIGANVIHVSFKYNVKKLLYLLCSCVYPKDCPQPMKEEYLLNGKFESTNEGYALAKISGLKLCEYYNKQFGTNFISLMSSNLYGPNDNFDPNASHVIPALIKKFLDAKNNNLDYVEVWGSGKAKREFLYVGDLAQACLYFIENYNAKELPSFINVGCGEDISIAGLVEIIKEMTGYTGSVRWDLSFPSGVPQKLLDNCFCRKLGWSPTTTLKDGLKKTIEWYKRGR